MNRFSYAASRGAKKCKMLAAAVLLVLIPITTQSQLLGPVDPPPLGVAFSQTGAPHDGIWGRVDGKDYFYSNVDHADNTTIFWGVETGGVRLSLDGPDYGDPGEVMSFDAGLSDLPNGIVVWAGQTTIKVFPGDIPTTAYTRFQITVTDSETAQPISLALASDQGLAADVGGIIPIENSALEFRVNLLFSASQNQAGPYEPHLDFFDPLTGPTQDGLANSSLLFGFYYVNTPPFLTNNQNNIINEGELVVIDATHLSADDYESGPEGLTFTIDPEDFGGIPQNGELRKSEIALDTQETFTQKDINDNQISYQHDGSLTTQDSFTFTVHDPEGAIAADGSFTIFKHTINITLTNDPPVAIDGSGTANIFGDYDGFFEGEDEEDDVLEFSVVSVDVGDVQLNDTLTGSFSYSAPPAYNGPAVIKFQVFDGEFFAETAGTFSITVPFNAPPVAVDDNGTATLDGIFGGTFQATGQEGETLTFSVVSVDFGSVDLLEPIAGEFLYDAEGYIGSAEIEFQVHDGEQFADVPGIFSITVPDPAIKVVNSGDLLIANGKELILHNLPENTDWVMSAGNMLNNIAAVAFGGMDQLFVLDRVSGLLRIDPITGDQVLIASGDNFFAEGPGNIAIEDDMHVLVADLDMAVGPPSLLRVNTGDGTVTTLASGDLLPFISATATGADGRVFAADASKFAGGESGIVEVDPVSGGQTSVSLGGLLTLPFAIAVEADGHILVADAPVGIIDGVNQVLRILPDGVPGDTANGVPAGVPGQFVLSAGGYIESAMSDITAGYNGRIFVANGSNVIEIDRISGEQTIVPTEPIVDSPSDIEVVLIDEVFADSFEDVEQEP